MQICFAKTEDTKNIKNLWSYCFTDDENYVNYYFKKKYKPENNLILKDKKEIAASLQLNPYLMIYGKTSLKISYIVGVSSKPEKRGAGYVTKLIFEALNHLYQKGENFTILMPIDTKIYTRYGFSNIADMESAEISLDRIDYHKTGLSVRRCSGSSYIKDLQNIYTFVSQNWDNYIYRNDLYFKNLLEEAGLENTNAFISYDENSRPVSYMFFNVKFEPGKKGYVSEFLSKNALGIYELLNVVKSHYTQIESVKIDMPADNNLKLIMKNDNKIILNKRPFIMGRVINAENMLKSNPYIKLMDFGHKLSIKVKDNIIKNNNRVFCFEKNALTVKKGPRAKYDIELDIYELTMLITSYVSADELLFITGKSLDSEALETLKFLFPKGINYFNDYV